MLDRSRAMGLVGYLLPASAVLVLAVSIFLGMTLARAGNGGRVVEIVLEPSTTQAAPAAIPIGATEDFTVRVITNGASVAGVTLSMTFESPYLEVVDAVPGGLVQIASHPDNPLTLIALPHSADNTRGTITFNAVAPLGTPGTSDDFNLAIITFRAKNNPTTAGDPTKVMFLVNNGDETSVSSAGALLLKNTGDFPGAWIDSQRVTEIEIEDAAYVATPRTMAVGSTEDFDVSVLTHGVQPSPTSKPTPAP